MEQAADRLEAAADREVLGVVLVLRDKDILQVLAATNPVAAAQVARELMEHLRGRTLAHRALVALALTQTSLLHLFLPN
jgi:4'-phosphopantetheinyl transferase EntD